MARRCPRCKNEIAAAPAGEPPPAWTPFCSERCKLLDLGAWLSGDYVIPGNRTEGPDAPPSPSDEDGELH